MKKLFVFIAFVLSQVAAKAQSPEMADVMRSEGKIYVVVAILLVVLFGLIVFVALTDRKVSKLEKLLKDKEK